MTRKVIKLVKHSFPGGSYNKVNPYLIKFTYNYKILVKKWHPDLFVNQPQMQKQVQEKMRLVNEAYNILNDYHHD